MVRKKSCTENSYDDLHSHLLNCEFLGKGHHGAVYLLPNNKVIKICFDKKSFTAESIILDKVNGNKYFPRIYEVGLNYMVRDYVEGEPLNKHIKKHGLSRDTVHEIIKMLKEFKRLKFKKIDIRCKDIFVQPNGKLKIIDPKNFYIKSRLFPKHLSKGLYNLGVLDFFFEVLKQDYPKIHKKWSFEITQYLEDRFDEF